MSTTRLSTLTNVYGRPESLFVASSWLAVGAEAGSRPQPAKAPPRMMTETAQRLDDPGRMITINQLTHMVAMTPTPFNADFSTRGFPADTEGPGRQIVEVPLTRIPLTNRQRSRL